MDKTEITYDSLCGMIESCIVPSSYKVLKDRKKMLVIAISEEVRFQKSIQKILKHNPEMEFIIVAQIGLQKVLEDVYRGRYPVIGWSGTYTAKLIDKVRKNRISVDWTAFFTLPSIQSICGITILSISRSTCRKRWIFMFTAIQ